MNWYLKNINKISAQMDSSLYSFLQRIGVPDFSIQKVLNITDTNIRQRIIGYLNKNPQSSVDEILKSIQYENLNKNTESNSQEEIQLSNMFPNAEFQKWLLINLRKLRTAHLLNPKNKSIGENAYYLDDRGSINITVMRINVQSIYDWYSRALLPAKAALQNAKTPEEAAEIVNEYGITSANTNLNSLTFEQALSFSDNWHEVMAGEGQGLEYFGEKTEDIVYGPKWKNKEYNGWTIKQIKTKNNLRTEGNRVGHCVGSYCEDVLKNKTRIFSLRDPTNTPYVTMEVNPSSWRFRQISGNGPKTGNADPSDNLKSMIGEWMSSLKGVSIEGQDEFVYDNLQRAYYSEIDDELEKCIYKGLEGYGVPVSLETWNYNEAYSSIIKALSEGGRRDNGGGYQTNRVAKTLAKAAVDSDIEKIQKGLSEEEFKKRAYSVAMREPTYNLISLKNFEKMSDENKNTYLKDFLSKAEDKIKKEIFEYTEDYYNKSTPYQSKQERIYNKAYYFMSLEKKFDPRKIQSFEQLDPEDQRKYLSMVIDSTMQISQAYARLQKDEEQFFDNYDSSYLYENDYFPKEPEEEEFATKEEYDAALENWENEKQKIEDDEINEFRNSNLPYNLNDKIIKNIQEILLTKNMKLPRWISIHFNKSKNQNYRPTILWVLEKVNDQKKKAKKKTKLSSAYDTISWYGLAKISQNNNLYQQIEETFKINNIQEYQFYYNNIFINILPYAQSVFNKTKSLLEYRENEKNRLSSYSINADNIYNVLSSLGYGRIDLLKKTIENREVDNLKEAWWDIYNFSRKLDRENKKEESYTAYNISRQIRDFEMKLEYSSVEYNDYSPEQALTDCHYYINETKKNAEKIATVLNSAVSRISNWYGSKIQVEIPSLSKDDDISIPADSATVEIGKDFSSESMNPMFSFFDIKEDGSVTVDDVGEAGDEDFFNDPKIQSDYFNLIKELRKPGSTSGKSRILSLYTARPVKDRSLYVNSKSIPSNIFLTNRYDSAIGLASDLSGTEKRRDVYKVRIEEKYLIQTLDGSEKQYQVVGEGSVPIVSIELVDYVD